MAIPDQFYELRTYFPHRDSVLPPTQRKRVAIEASHYAYWYKHVGLDGRIIAMDRFGESAPTADLFKYYGFTIDNIVEQVEAMLPA